MAFRRLRSWVLAEAVFSWAASSRLAQSFVYPQGIETCKQRLYSTDADGHYRKYSAIPRPEVMHFVLLDEHLSAKESKGFLVIGDVHGCLEELKLLHEKAISFNDGVPFRQVILLGDLVNKGPESAKVVKYVRQQSWLSVRGNHDDGALATALGDEARRKKKKYQWVLESNDTERMLSDADVKWLAELPYTIRIPSSLLGGTSQDVLLLHAGLIPGIKLEDQAIDTMVTIRWVEPTEADGYKFHEPGSDTETKEILWGEVWNGPEHVYFGHDARRGYQQHKFATGLDTGAVYGGKLSGIILPERKLVQVDSVRQDAAKA